ncbi:MAG: type II toxin-antitoxin system RelE/ParE family toxin [Treponema sp.]|jgi:hypothetical protein|nr:type II toxin-antitoxin system RelE/ParE family toxin [Treponema sp.]
MTREFVMMPEFERQWKRLGLRDDDLRELQQILLENPKAGPVMRETGGLRKIRKAFEGKGKSGSARVAYVDFPVYETTYLITVFAKSEKDNLSKQERNNIAKVISGLEQGLQRDKYRG